MADKKTKTESFVRGAAHGGSLGFADEIAGLLEAFKYLGSSRPETFGEEYTKGRDESRKEYSQAKGDNPGTFTAGELGGAIASGFIPGLNVAKGATLAQTAGKAALSGALAGAGASEAEGAKVAGDAVGGALLGGMAGAFGESAGAVANKLAAFPGLKKWLSQEAAQRGGEAANRGVALVGALQRLRPSKNQDEE